MSLLCKTLGHRYLGYPILEYDISKKCYSVYKCVRCGDKTKILADPPPYHKVQAP